MINKLEINPLYNISHLFPSAIEMVCYVLFLNTINELPEKLFSGYIIWKELAIEKTKLVK